MLDPPNLVRMLEKNVFRDCSDKFSKFSFFGPFRPFFEKKRAFYPFFSEKGPKRAKNEKIENLSLQSLKTFFSSILTKFGGSITKTEGEDLFFVIF